MVPWSWRRGEDMPLRLCCRPCLLLAALAVSLPRAVGATEVVIDDQDGEPWFLTTGDDWTTWGTLGHGIDDADTSYHYTSHTVGGSDRRGTATWTPELPVAGAYAVAVWFRRTENRTDDADHLLHSADGSEERVSLDQRGEGASGWVELGEVWCEAGFGSCWLTLDGDDDDQSDEANAARFVLVVAEEEGGGDEPEGSDSPCSSEPGSHTWAGAATAVAGTGWESEELATGAADGLEASSPNVDEGEALRARDFELCEASEGSTVDAVRLSVRARTQYASGTYALELRLGAGGEASTVFTGTDLDWHVLTLTGDGRTWTWEDLQDLEAVVELHDHPGGARDSDAWVDAFSLEVDYSVPQPDGGDGADGGDAADGEAGAADTASDGASEEGRQAGPRPPEGTACASGGRGEAPGGGALPLLLLGLLLRRGERPGSHTG